jgi:hypothetical protein
MTTMPSMLFVTHAVATGVLGAGLGIASAAGLRRAVDRLIVAAPSGRRLAAGMLLRSVLYLGPIAVVAAGRPVALLSGLLAFLLLRRLAIVRLARVGPATTASEPAA